MTFDELSQKYDGIIPREEKRIARTGSYRKYYEIFLECAERNFAARCLRLTQAIAAWRTTTRYEYYIQQKMLERLSGLMTHSRLSALAAFDLSKVAVTAAPINTA